MKPILYIPYSSGSKKNRNLRIAAQSLKVLGMLAITLVAGYVLHVMGSLEAMAGLR